MRAVTLSAFGPPENLLPSDVPEPHPGADQSLIEVQFANITFVETQIRAGHAPNPAMLPQLPAILGNGVGGTDRTGRRVIAATGGTGGYAERAVASAASSCSSPATPVHG
jgi:NADPH:quinone reductase